MSKKIQAASLPSWLNELKPVLIAMAGSGAKPLISKFSDDTVTLRYQSRTSYIDPTLMRRAYNIMYRNKLAMVQVSKVTGLFVTIGPEAAMEAATGATV